MTEMRRPAQDFTITEPADVFDILVRTRTRNDEFSIIRSGAAEYRFMLIMTGSSVLGLMLIGVVMMSYELYPAGDPSILEIIEPGIICVCVAAPVLVPFAWFACRRSRRRRRSLLRLKYRIGGDIISLCYTDRYRSIPEIELGTREARVMMVPSTVTYHMHYGAFDAFLAVLDHPSLEEPVPLAIVNSEREARKRLGPLAEVLPFVEVRRTTPVRVLG